GLQGDVVDGLTVFSIERLPLGLKNIKRNLLMSYRILQKIGRLKMTDLLLNLHQETHILAYFGIPYFGNLFNIDENETNIDENDMMAVVE
ncbi:hypothetical protein QYM36_012478, partial [Artemia franciscana]